jgi:Zn-dependent protease with chaperone function
VKEKNSSNPTQAIEINFVRYLQRRLGQLSAHLENEVPDYAFSLDYELRQKLAAIKPVRMMAAAFVSSVVPIQKHIQQMNGIAVGPKQLPEIYTLGEECARTLGIGIPQIFIYPSPELSAYTFATTKINPMIVLSSQLVQVLEPLELKFVIGHECGHIHNLHSVYNTAVEIMINPMARAMLQAMAVAGMPLGALKLTANVLSGALKLFFMKWSRCAEITCDRAGVICCGEVRVGQTALARIATGGAENLKGINLDEYVRQIDNVRSSPLRLMELMQSHPLIPKRIEALRLFENCEVFRSWKPESGQQTMQSREETNRLCEKLINVLDGGRRFAV